MVMLCGRFPPSSRNVAELLFERGIDIWHETLWMLWNRFGPPFAADVRRQLVLRMPLLRCVLSLATSHP